MTPKLPIQTISDWPGGGDRGERKVPTALVYNANNTISSWGFLCADDDTTLPRKTRCEFFKLSLDAETLAGAHAQGIKGAPASTLEAQRLTTDYLAQVFRHIKGSIERELGRQHIGGWTDMSVQFLFSVPTTWTSLRVVRVQDGDSRCGVWGRGVEAQGRSGLDRGGGGGRGDTQDEYRAV